MQGHEVLKKIENVGDEEGIPTVTVKIINCGELTEGNKTILAIVELCGTFLSENYLSISCVKLMVSICQIKRKETN